MLFEIEKRFSPLEGEFGGFLELLSIIWRRLGARNVLEFELTRGRSLEMTTLVQQGVVGGWHLAMKEEHGCQNRVATKYKEGMGYQIESQLEWVEYFEGEEVAKEERWMSVSIGRYGGIETLPLDVLVWLMTGKRRGAARAA